MKPDKKNGTLLKVLRYLKPYLPFLAISLLFSAGTSVLSLLVPIFIGDMIDAMIAAGNVDFAVIYSQMTAAAVCILIAAAMQWGASLLNNRVAYGVVRDMRMSAFRHIQSLPLSYLDTHPTGETVSRIISDVESFSDGLLLGFSNLFTGVVTIVATLGFMISKSLPIALVVVLLTPLSFVVAKFIASRTYSMFKAQSAARGEQTAIINEYIGNSKVVKAFSYENEAEKKFVQSDEKLRKASLKAIFFSSLTNPSTRFVNAIIYAVVAVSGAYLCITSPSFTVGALSALLSYANKYTKPFNEISSVITEFQNSLACAGRVLDLIEQPTEPAEGKRELKNVKGEVALNNVSFSYVPEKPLIENLSVKALSGQRVAIVGPTGCGKTTVINLLMRFYDVKSGSVTVDGVDIRDVTRSSLRKEYGMVLQETWLKSGTVRDNIRMGKPDASDDEVVAAAKASHADPFIRRLPSGYDTLIGEDGGSLSQGQKQLLCISRIMLCLPPMLILDEATSSIDTRTELKIQSAFARLMKGRTSFIVAHRLSTVREADIILVMQAGHVIEQGSHAELMKKDGFYARLFNSQFEK